MSDRRRIALNYLESEIGNQFDVFCPSTGIPVWVGRKIHTRYKLAGKHKRNCAVLGAVTASVSYYSFVFLFAGLGWTKERL